MAKVTGLGGVFFKSKDPAALAAWYGEHLGLVIAPSFGGTIFKPGELPDGGYTLWSPFKSDTSYFGDASQSFMINLIVDDVEGALAQVKAGGAEVINERENGEFGDFGWFVDPDGNRVELWKPPAGDAS